MTKVRFTLLLNVLFLWTIGTQLNAQCASTSIETTDGKTTVYTCPGDGIDDLINLTNDGTGTNNYAYVATDLSFNILGIPPGNTFNFDGAGTGACLVWGVEYSGNILAQMGDNIFGGPFSDGCFQVSNNLVRVVRDNPDGGTITAAGGSNEITVCTTDPYPDDILFSHQNNSNSAYTYLITDANNNILGMTNQQNFNFDGVPVGVCRIWGLSYTGNLTAPMGVNAATTDLSDDCFELSDNFIEVTRTDVDGGTVADGNGANALTICAGDGTPDVVNFTHVSNSGSTYRYIVTDENGIVLGLPPGNSLDFNGAGVGVCLVWGLSYTGDLTLFVGDNALNKSLSTDCYELSENFIEVTRTGGVDGGTVATSGGETVVYTCPGDGIDDIIEFSHSNSSTANFAYVITDDNNNILGLPPGNSQNFDGAGVGVCRVWGLSFTGNITAMMGDNAATTQLTDGCFTLSSNFIEVNRSAPDGGTVSTAGGETMVYTCPGNGIDDIIEFAHVSTSTSNYRYVVTDDNNIILGIPPANAQNFDGAPVGTCRVWGLAFTGEITATPGDNAATTQLTDGCFNLSSNFVEVRRVEPEGGNISAGGATTVYTCPGDGNADIIDFSTSNVEGNFQIVITDADYNILGLPPANSQNFEGAGTGTCLVWSVGYTGNILAGAGDNIFSTQFSSDCWDFSDPVRVVRDVAEGGTIQSNNGNNVLTFCTTDGNADIVSYSHNTVSNSAYTYLITDANNNILGQTSAPDFNFEGVPAGVCRIWGLSYSGTLSAPMGVNAATATLSDGCFDLSDNFIEVTRTDVQGGTVAMPSGETTRYTCTQDGNPDIVMFTHVSNSPAAYRYVITDDSGNVLGLPPGAMADFDGAPAGNCQVWGLSYTGDLTLFAGDNIFNKSLSTDCYDLSENFIEIIRDTPEGGTVSMPSGATTRYTCTQDGTPDVVMFTNQGTSNSKYAYIITSPTLEILGVEFNDYHDFDNAPPGTCWVWGLSYTGNITAMVGDNAGQVSLTDDCADLSDNFIEVIRDMTDGGTVQTTNGETAVTITAGDGIDDIISFESMGTSNSNFVYVITDDNNNILGMPPGNSQNFEEAGVGVCRVWGLSYTGNITAMVGDNAAQVDLTDDCFSLSSNYIEVTRIPVSPFQGNGNGNTLLSNTNEVTLEATIFPNPATDYLTVDFGKSVNLEGENQIRVYNSLGQIVISQSYESDVIDNSQIQLDVNNLPNGNYYISIEGSGQVVNKKFVKTNF